MAIEDLSYSDYFAILKRRWPLVLVGGSLGALIGYATAQYQAEVPRFQSYAMVRFKPQGGFALGETREEKGALQRELTVVRGAPVLGNAAKRLGWLSPDVDPADYFDHLGTLIRLVRRIDVKVTGGDESGLIRIVATAPSPDAAAAAANAMAAAYQEENLRTLRETVGGRRDFIEEQLSINEERMNQGQLDYELFRRAHPEVAFGPRVEEQINRLANEESRALEISGKIDEVRRQLALLASGRPVSDLGVQAIVGGASTARITQLSSSYTSQRLARASLLTELTLAHPRVIQVEEQITAVRNELEEELQLLVDAFEQRRAEIELRVEEMRFQQDSSLDENARDAMTLASLERKVKVYANIELRLRAQLEDSLVREAGVRGQVTLNTPAIPSNTPLELPDYTRLSMIGLIGGLFAGIAFGVALDSRRFTIAQARRLETGLEAPILGVHPRITLDRRSVRAREKRLRPGTAEWSRHLAMTVLLDPDSVSAEAFRMLRVSVEPRIDEGSRLFTLTASSRREGTTTTVVNLALSLARTGRRTLVIETNFRNPGLEDLLGLHADPGLADILLDTATADESIRTMMELVAGRVSLEELLLGPGADLVHFLPSGRPSAFAAEPFTSPTFEAFILDVQQRYDVILFDTAPLDTAVDALILGRISDVIVVFDPEQSREDDAVTTVAALRRARSQVLGLFLNGADPELAEATGTGSAQRAA